MSSKELWASAAKNELKGRDPIAELTKRWDEQIILPYYDEGDLRFNIEPVFRAKETQYGGPNNWLNLPLVDAADPNANSIALQHLEGGADGVVFRIHGLVALDEITKNINRR